VDPFLKQILDDPATHAIHGILKGAHRADGTLESRVAALAEQNRALANEVLRLRAAIVVLAEAMGRGQAIDPDRALARMRELMTVLSGDEPTVFASNDATEPAIKLPTHRPSTSQPGAKQPSSDPVFECQRCRKVVPAHASYVTSQGTLCASCYAASPG
jgi:hypothetical protein